MFMFIELMIKNLHDFSSPLFLRSLSLLNFQATEAGPDDESIHAASRTAGDLNSDQVDIF